jgi:molybdenum cofactor biosynthesis enzyme MoaA
MPLNQAIETLKLWCNQGLKNLRFSGGEPLVYQGLTQLVSYAKMRGVERIAISSNGSFPLSEYYELLCYGVNDFSISLDACCAADSGVMSGVNNSSWDIVTKNIRALAKETYVTVGVVLTEDNVGKLAKIVEFADNLGVADIRIISAAQYNHLLEGAKAIPQRILDAHPILKYRVENILRGRNVRGIEEYDSPRCYLPVDDSIVCGDKHYPCVIYFREGGAPIGQVGPNMRQERVDWCKQHKSQLDPICSQNCLDVCIDHNNCCAYIEKACNVHTYRS